MLERQEYVGGRGRDRTGHPLLAKKRNEIYLTEINEANRPINYCQSRTGANVHPPKYSGENIRYPFSRKPDVFVPGMDIT